MRVLCKGSLKGLSYKSSLKFRANMDHLGLVLRDKSPGVTVVCCMVSESLSWLFKGLGCRVNMVSGAYV